MSDTYSSNVDNQISATETIEKADYYEIEEPLTSANQWISQLNSNNTSFVKTDLEHDVIQSVLEKKGVTGLNKYQYQQVLKEENIR